MRSKFLDWSNQHGIGLEHNYATVAREQALNHTRILHIEDDYCDAQLLQRMLTKSQGGYVVDRAENLASGLNLARASNYPIIVVDFRLPGVDGFKAIEQLASEFPESAVVVSSGNVDESMHTQAIEHGAVDFICKSEMSPSMVHRCFQQNLLRLAQHEQIQELLRHVNEQNREVERQAAQLHEKNVHLERLNEESRKFVNNVSHEFRTPLCVIKQYASLIADDVVGTVNDEQRKMLRTIEDRVDDLNNMVDDMLDISRFESGMLSAQRQIAYASDILLRIIPPLKQRARLRDITIECKLDENLPALYCDPEKASRTLINLVANAIKFSHRSGLITIRVQHNPKNSDVSIAVEDQGVGIPAAQHQELFDRFRQGTGGASSSTKGFGLGLNIARELVELNLGAVTIESEVGVGSTFAFTLPVFDRWEVTSRFLKRLATNAAEYQLDAVSIRLPDKHNSSSEAASDEVHSFLNLLLKANELLLRTGPNSWLLLLDSRDGVSVFLARLQQEFDGHNRNRPQGPLPKMLLANLGQYDPTADYETIRELVQHTQLKPPHFARWQSIGSTQPARTER